MLVFLRPIQNICLAWKEAERELCTYTSFPLARWQQTDEPGCQWSLKAGDRSAPCQLGPPTREGKRGTEPAAPASDLPVSHSK